MWILTGTAASGAPVTFRLSPGTVKTVGRANHADFCLDEALVSRVHCRLAADGESLQVVDLASTNGIYVNDRRVEKARLASGDRLRIGRVEFTIERALNA